MSRRNFCPPIAARRIASGAQPGCAATDDSRLSARHRFVLAGLGLDLVLSAGGCTAPPAPSSTGQVPAPATEGPAAVRPPAPAALPVEPLVTLQDLMVNEVDYSADRIWDASGQVIDAHGSRDLRPRTDAEWAQLRHHAVVLLEATNLLVIPNRKVAAVPFPSDGPGVNSSEEIQRQIDANRIQFNAYALALRAVARQELEAIDRHDADRLFALGNDMDSACEACHKANWYPHEVVPDPPANPPAP